MLSDIFRHLSDEEKQQRELNKNLIAAAAGDPVALLDPLLAAARKGDAGYIARVLSDSNDGDTLAVTLKALMDDYKKNVPWNGTLDTILARDTEDTFFKAAKILVEAGADVTAGGCSLTVRELPKGALRDFLAEEREQKVFPAGTPPIPRI
jgi:hypothetical protein